MDYKKVIWHVQTNRLLTVCDYKTIKQWTIFKQTDDLHAVVIKIKWEVICYIQIDILLTSCNYETKECAIWVMCHIQTDMSLTHYSYETKIIEY
jgi:hypothetical protein